MSGTSDRPLRRRIGRAGLLLLLLASVVSPTLAQSPDAPPVVSAIHRGFEGFFLFTTNGSGRYRIYQKVEDETGIGSDADVTCLQRDCFLRLADVPGTRLGRDAPLGALRVRFRAVQAAYAEMRSRPDVEREAGVWAWWSAIGQLRACLKGTTAGECHRS